MQIIPAILAREFREIKEKIAQLEGLVEWVQIDVVDGEFAAPPSWPYLQGNAELAERLKEIQTPIKMELHLMVQDPEEDLDEWLQTPARRIVVHDEAGNLKETELILDMTQIEWGVALNLQTPIRALHAYGHKLDVVQLMSIDVIGAQGAPLKEKVFKKIASLRKKYPNVTIQVDGGVNIANIKLLKDSGVDNVVVGSAIWESGDVKGTIEQLKHLATST